MDGLASVHNKFPIYLLCRIVKKTEITINPLQTSQKDPILWAYAQLFGVFEFNATTMAPPGTTVIDHKK